MHKFRHLPEVTKAGMHVYTSFDILTVGTKIAMCVYTSLEIYQKRPKLACNRTQV